MRVLVTRPEHSGQTTSRRLEAMGHEPVAFPLFRATHLPLHSNWQEDAVGGSIFTSAEALRSLGESGPIPDWLLARTAYTVGKATARAACGAGFRKIEVAGGDGAALADLIAARHDPARGRLLYFAGEPRSPALESGLRAKDIEAEILPSYRMEAIAYTASDLNLLEGGELAVLLYSREAALRFAQLAEAGDGTSRLTCYCLSGAIAAALPPALRGKAKVADETTEDALLGLLTAQA